MKNPNLVQIQKRNKRGILSKYWVNPNSDKTIYEIENKVAVLVTQDSSFSNVNKINSIIKESKQSTANKVRLLKKVETASGDTLVDSKEDNGAQISHAQSKAVEKTINESSVKNISIDKISAESEGQIRKEFNKDQLLELANSIKAVGLVSPIVVRPDKEKPGHFKIIAGERRFRALQLIAKETGEKMQASVIIKSVSDADKDILQAVENLVRANNTPMEISDHFAKLINSHKFTLQEISKQTSTPLEQVRNYMKLQNLSPDIRKMFEKGEIPKVMAYALGRTENASIQRRALGIMLSKGISASQSNSVMSSILDQPEFFTEAESMSKEQIVAKKELDKQNVSETSAQATFNRLVGKQREFIDKFVKDGSMQLSTLGLVASGKLDGAVDQMENVIRDMELIVQNMKKERAKLSEGDGLFKSDVFDAMSVLYESILDDIRILEKAFKNGLVSKTITVQRGGKTFPMIVWVRPGEEKKEHKFVRSTSGSKITIPPNGDWIDEAVGIIDTYEKYYKDGKPTPERQPLHEMIIRDAVEKVKPTPGKKEAIVLMGAPASGKSTIVRTLNVDQERFVVTDADNVKEKLPEYNQGVMQRARNSAKLVHEESSDIVGRMRKMAIDTDRNIVIDGTGANYNKYIVQIKELQSKGYEVTLIYAHSDKKTGVERAMARAEKTGRFIPPEFIEDAYDKIPSNFHKLVKEVDNVFAFDTRKSDDYGSPVNFYKKVKGKEEVKNKDIYKEVEV